MTEHRRGRRSSLGLIVAASLTIASLGLPRPVASADGLQAWQGGIDLYRAGTYSAQKSWLWCTAAGVQIVRNIVDVESDHTSGAQRRYFAWMRLHNRYHLPLSAGVDPQGWVAGLRQFVDDRYRLVASTTFDGALRSAVRRLRQTNLPVALTVSHGNHGWILTGFTATSDPLTTANFKVTSVRVTGPLYGLQSRNGYDMAPDTKLTPTQLHRFFTPWKYVPMSMVWDGRYVSIQPVPVVIAAAPTPTSEAATQSTNGLADAGSTQPTPVSPTSVAVPASARPAAVPGPRGTEPAAVAFDTTVCVVVALLALLVLALLMVRRRAIASIDRPGCARSGDPQLDGRSQVGAWVGATLVASPRRNAGTGP